MKRITKIVGTLSFLGCAVTASHSAVAADSGWYVGGNVGQSRTKIDDAQITAQLLGGGLATTSITSDNRDTSYKLFGGYQFNKNFALEAGYFDLGKFGFTATTLPPGTLNGNIKLKGMNLDAVGILPITEKFSVFGRIGLNYAEAKDSFTGAGLVNVINPNPSKHETNPKIGLGLQYAFTEALGMRVEAERYRIKNAVGNKGDVDLVSVGLIYRFGGETPTPAPVQKVAAPEPVAPEPQVVVVVVTPPPPPPDVVTPPPQHKAVTPPPPPPPPPPKKVIFSADSSADSLFDFDKIIITPAGKQALDKFTADLKGANFDVITVTGHTDRIGSPAYNMRLSNHRAEAVKAYLVESAGIPADMIAAKGVGESDPVTKPGECTSEKTTEELLVCLQPDRRVEVEVTATRVSK